MKMVILLADSVAFKAIISVSNRSLKFDKHVNVIFI